MFNKSIHKPWLLGIFVVGVSALFGDSAQAQITPDRTLPNNSIVTPNGSTLNITGGTQAGANLFHSFREFSVPTGSEAVFNNGVDISNIISRVTGPNPSNIDGLIRTLYTANLFVINPNGIVFGPNARLNVGGSFVATTANAIQFGNQGFFSANVPNNPALLTINPNALLFNQIAAAPIQNNSRARASEPMDVDGLVVPDGKSLLLVGGNINMDGGKLKAFGGRVELGGLAATGTVGLNVDGNLLSLSFPNNLDLASVSLSNDSNVDVSGGSGSGSITINARDLTFGNSGLTAINAGNVNINARNAVSLEDGSVLFAATNGNQNAGSVTINAGDSVSLNNGSSIFSQVQQTGIGNGGVISINTRALSLTNGAALFANTEGAGSAGSVTIHAGDSVSLNGSSIFSQVQQTGIGNGGVISINTRALSLTNGAGLFASSDGAGAAGSVNLNASDRVSLENGSGVYNRANSNAIGNSGGISITTGTLSLTGATLLANTDGNGNAGSVIINAGDSVSLNGSNIFSNVEQNGKGNGGVISINTRSLSLTNGAGLFANTQGAGSAGSVNLNASDRVSLDGDKSGVYNSLNSNAMGNSGGISITTGTLSLTNGATLFASTNGNGNAGSVSINAGDSVSLNGSNIFSQVQENGKGNGGVISINTRLLSLTNGAGLFAQTYGAGSTGSVKLNASDRVSLDGDKSGVYNTANSNAMGDSGGISITTGTLSLTNGAQLNTSTSGQANAGDIILEARDGVSLTNGAQLNTSTSGQANAGDIILEAGDRVSFNNSSVFTSAGETATGKGGNLYIKSGDISFANGTILILATSGKGDAGNATITTRSLSLTDGSLLTASSKNSAGKAGNISIENAEFVSLSGNNPINRRSTEISSDTRSTSTGSGGNITIDAAKVSVSNGAIINARTTSSGTGGSITINSKTFEATNGGELISTTSGRASAGNITVNATDRVIVNGSDPTVNERRIAFKATGEDLGNVESASGFFALSSSSASAGEIKVSAPQIRLDNQGKFSANSASGNGGNIELQITDLLLLRHQSLISTSAGNANAGGNGGKIKIEAPNGFVIAVPNESSNITANAFFGSGGKIEIRSFGIFGLSVLSREDLEKRFGKNNHYQLDLQQLLQQQPTNVITAISQQNPDLSGTVQINTPNVDPSRGLVQLPTKSADSLKLIDRSCTAFEGTQGSSFVVSGRGGLPPSPDEPLSADAVWSDTRLQAYTAQQHSAEKPAAKPHSKHEPEPVAILPATGWVFNGKGEVTLISTASNPTGHSSTPATCREE